MVPFHSKVNQIVPYRSISICKIQHSKANASVFFLGFFEGFTYQSAVFHHESFLLPSFDVSVQSHIGTHSFFYQREKTRPSTFKIDIGLMSSGKRQPSFFSRSFIHASIQDFGISHFSQIKQSNSHSKYAIFLLDL